MVDIDFNLIPPTVLKNSFDVYRVTDNKVVQLEILYFYFEEHNHKNNFSFIKLFLNKKN